LDHCENKDYRPLLVYRQEALKLLASIKIINDLKLSFGWILITYFLDSN
jgi:hypothetical protein